MFFFQKGPFCPRKHLLIAVILSALWTTAYSAGVLADPPQPAPPPDVQLDVQANDVGAARASEDKTYNWSEVPLNRQVAIDRATFDLNGFDLIDRSNETILVPFPKNNPYVMQFAQTERKHMYFVNKGDGPVFYIPKNSYLSYALQPDARWYPMTRDFHPVDPVYEGLAPTWDALINMTWYPEMVFQGGYWSSKPVGPHAPVAPTPGLTFLIAGGIYRDWATFMSYTIEHPTKGR
jgi:hypothetical protein